MISRTRRFFLGGGAILTALLFRPVMGAGAASSSFAMTPEQFWHMPFATDSRIPLAGDADGDGHADLISFSPSDGVIELARTSPLGKPTYGNVALRDFGKDGITAACGPFVRKAPAADVVAVFADGSVRVAWGMTPGANEYPHNDLAAQIPPAWIPKAPVKTAVADFDGDGKADVIILGRDGALLLLRNTGPAEAPAFTPVMLKNILPGVRQFAAGPTGDGKRGRCVWLDETGSVYSATVDQTTGLGTPDPLAKVSPDEHLVVGHFRGDKSADVLIGQKLLAGGDPNAAVILKDLPSLAVAKGDGVWVATDVDGNGKDDLVRYRRSNDPLGGQDTYVHFSYDATDKSKGYYCSSNDGLPDFWKTGQVKPGGLDLAAMGCKVGHRDVIVEVERFENIKEDWLKGETDRVIRYFAAMPIQNLDGRTGVAMHVLYAPVFPLSRHDELMNHFDDNFPRVELRGIVHSMFAAQPGPLVSKGNGDNSHYDGTWKVFLHEFGHQLDLRHDGWHPTLTPNYPSDTGCALYPSLMSYTYSYSRGDDGEAAGYSDGARASFHVNEQHLSERLPFPIDKVQYLAGDPYHFHIKPSEDGKSTLVDWNWNGVFGEEDVRADINYSHGVDFGPRYDIGTAQTAPVLVAHGEGAKQRLLLFYGKSAQPNVRLTMRSWLGTNRDSEGTRWSEEIVLADSDLTGDSSAAYLGKGVTWLAYPTERGVVLRSITMNADGRPRAGVPSVIGGTAGVQPTLTSYNGRLALFLWKNPDTPVALRFLSSNPNSPGLVSAGGQYLDFVSGVPVGSVAGGVGPEGPSLWVGRQEGGTGDKAGHTEVLRLVPGPDNQMRIADRSWLDGMYSTHRMTLLWEKMPGLPQGRLYQLSGGITTPAKPWAEQFITMNTAYPEVGGGWLYRRYHAPDFSSASAPGACLFQGDIAYAIRMHDNDTLGIAFYGSGANPTPMGDYDDFARIRDYGLSRSIRELPH